MLKTLFISLIILAAIGCGGSSSVFPPDVPTDSPPIVSRIEPIDGPVGTEVTIYGLGFSFSAPVNVITIGGVVTNATSYQLVDNPTETEIEAITATIPDNAQDGVSPVVVIVYENASNDDVTFEIIP